MREIDPIVIDRIKSFIATGASADLSAFVDSLHPADIVDILDNLSTDEQKFFILAISSEKAADIIQELDPTDQGRLLQLIDIGKTSEILREMDSDDAADVLGEMPESRAESILNLMNSEGEEVRELLQYDEDSSGGIMTTEYVAVRRDWTVGQTLAELRKAAPEAETVYYVYVIDDCEHLVGVLSLRDLVISSLDTKIDKIMDSNVVFVTVDADQEEAARLFKKYGFLTLPVVDHECKLTGIITADDILDVVEEEATEDIQKMSGTLPLDHPYLDTRIRTLWGKRIVWLLVLFVTGSVTATILQSFEDVLTTVVALTFFIPLLIDCGGNAGSQASAIVIRALAVRELRVQDFLRVLWREICVGLPLGAAMAFVAFILASVMPNTGWDWMHIGLTVGLAVLVIVVVGSVAGAILPIVATSIGLDPAVIAGPLITTIVDAMGLIVYLGIARMVLRLA